MPTLDIDLLDEGAASAVEYLAREHFSDRGTFLVRIGRAPKRAIPFRTSTPFAKIQVELRAPNSIITDKPERLEILGDGQQVVVAGIHPETGKPYAWFGGEPWQVSAAELPAIGEAAARAFIDAAVQMLIAEYGYTIAGKTADKAAEDGGSSRSWGDCVNAILTGKALHDSLTVLAAKLVTAGMADPAAVGFLPALSLGSSQAAKDERWRERYDEIPRAVRSARAKFSRTSEEVTELFWYGQDTATAPRAWLVDGMLPQTGIGLVSGQWGTFKTFVTLDLAAAVMAGMEFLGAPVARGGACCS